MKEHRTLEYLEAVGDDLLIKDQLPFPTLTGANPDETVIFAYIVYRSREQRDAVNEKVMSDRGIHEFVNPESPLFDCERMACGGLTTLVEA